MKSLIILISIALTSSAHSQNQQVFAKFIIKSSKWNNVDVTKRLIEARAEIIFYYQNDTTMLMSNYHDATDSQSYGGLYPANDSGIQLKKNERLFIWQYNNTYDKVKGFAWVKLIKLNRPIGFALQIIPDNGDRLYYNGNLVGANRFFFD